MTERDKADAGAMGQLDEDAALWCVRMHGEEAEQWREPFEQWLRRGALHRQAYNRIEEVYLLGDRVQRRGSDQPAAAAARHRPWLSVLAGAAVTAAVVIGFMVNGRAGSPPASQSAIGADHAHVVAGETRPASFTLTDGSVVTLLAGGAARMTFSPALRTIDLERGTGRFAVAHEQRPFVVYAGGGSITARGTLFEVSDLSKGRIDVHLIEGQVDVAPPSIHAGAAGGDRRVTRLHAGQKLSFAALPHAVDLKDQAGADGQPATVGEMVDQANSLSKGAPRLVVADEALRAIRVGGRFKAHDPEKTADRLAVMLRLEIDRSRPGVLLLRRR